MKQGIFYGVGIGPGDPELITRKAVRILESCPVIAAPQTGGERTLALEIARQAADLSGKTIVTLPFAMSRDREKQRAAHETAVEAIVPHLREGRDVAMLNLGDVSIYATYGYLMGLIQEQGFETEMIPGVPSFCAAAARLGISLTEMNQPLHILPAGGCAVEEELALTGTKVLMKSGKIVGGAQLRPAGGTGVPGSGSAARGSGILPDSDCEGVTGMVHFVGAGPGAPDLITLRGAELLKRADVIIYAGSLVNPALLAYAKEGCRVYNSAEMTLEQVIAVLEDAERGGLESVRLHTGDPSVYGAIREQMDALDRLGIPYDDTPGVSSFCGAAASLRAEYTLPGVSQSVIITRVAGRTPVPEAESVAEMARHGASMVLFLSAGMLDKLQAELLKGAYTENTPAAIVYKATWPEEKVVRCTVGTLAESGAREGIRKTALVLVGDFLGAAYERSKLYDPAFTTEFREATQ